MIESIESRMVTLVEVEEARAQPRGPEEAQLERNPS
jgi:hypothetical protein